MARTTPAASVPAKVSDQPSSSGLQSQPEQPITVACVHNFVPPHIFNSSVHTPLHVSRFELLLRHHPDKEFASYVLNGLRYGFSIGFTASRDVSVQSANLPSSAACASFISDQLYASCQRGETAGPFSAAPFTSMRCSGVGAVPKKNGKLRMIHHLSSPAGNSVNDGVPADQFSLHYISIDDAIESIMSSPQPVYLAKLDIKSAFRQIPVRAEDHSLLGIFWQGNYYYERVLPFGLRSSPAIFDSVASAIEWIIRNHFSIADLFHYLDDFLNVTTGNTVAQRQLAILLRAFIYLGVPLAPAKVEGPARSLTFLGIILDCERLEARLPMDKLNDLRSLLASTINSRKISQRQLESLLGKLSFAVRVITPGRTFMRRLWSLCSRFQQPHYSITLTQECVDDLLWWMRLLSEWNGKSFFLHPNWTPSPDLQLYTDASGTHGWGAYNNGKWIQGSWNSAQMLQSIEWKELFALVAACATWGDEWAKLRIRVHCDNSAVVDCIRSGTCKAPAVMKLLRELFFVCYEFNFHVSAVHIAGSKNVIADCLSRFLMQEFRRHAPLARPSPDRARLPAVL